MLQNCFLSASRTSLISRAADSDKKEVVSIIKIVEDSLVLCREKFKNHDIQLRYNYNHDSELCVLGRAAQFSQVLLNLLNNSFDSVRVLDDKWISIDIILNSDVLKLTVTDSGPAIESELVEKIMNPFFTTKEVGKGTGLGLSISKSIIEEQSGKLYYNVDSANASFIIELPLIDTTNKDSDNA